jgi:pilus assembly protein CpaD
MMIMPNTAAKSCLCAAAVAILLAGCSAEDFPMVVVPKQHDYRLNHPLTVTSGSAVTWITFSADTAALPAGDIAKLGRYFASYIVAGHGRIKASVNRQNISEAVAAERVRALRAVAAQEGVKPREIEFEMIPTLQATGGPVSVKLSYLRYIAGLPKCPDWSKDMIYGNANTIHSNFGCATQSNLGAMVVDPADLVRMRPLAPSDAEIGDNAIRVLRLPSGTTSGAAATSTGSTTTPTGTTTGGATGTTE